MIAMDTAAPARRADSFARQAKTQFVRAQPLIVLVLGVAATLVALAMVVNEVRQQGLASMLALVSSGFWFWATLLASLLVEPLAGYWIMRRQLGTGWETMAPLLRKQSLNTLLFGYAGDTLFMAWLQKHIGNARAAFALICDMAIVSALVNNIATLGLLILMWRPLQSLAGAQVNGWVLAMAAGLSAIPLALMAWRHKAMRGAGLPAMMAAFGLRTVVTNVLIAATWYFAMPQVSLVSLLLLTTARMVVSRLPIVPNKDLAFAGCVVLFLGPNELIGPMVAGVALLTLAVQAGVLAVAPGLSWARREAQSAAPLL